jgi:hypothetical protein
MAAMLAVCLISWLASYLTFRPRKERPARPVMNAIYACNVLLAILGVGLPMAAAFALVSGAGYESCGPTASGTQDYIDTVQILAACFLLGGIIFAGLGANVLMSGVGRDRKWGGVMAAIGVALLVPVTLFAVL